MPQIGPWHTGGIEAIWPCAHHATTVFPKPGPAPQKVRDFIPNKPCRATFAAGVAGTRRMTVYQFEKSGWGGIRTRGTDKSTHAFQACPIDRSGTHPMLSTPLLEAGPQGEKDARESGEAQSFSRDGSVRIAPKQAATETILSVRWGLAGKVGHFGSVKWAKWDKKGFCHTQAESPGGCKFLCMWEL